MKTASEIYNLARTNKSILFKHFFGGSYYLNRNLGSLMKHELHAMLLLTIEKPVELCRFLKTPFSEFEYIINNPSYIHYRIPKKKGGMREIFAPSENLKSIQKRLNYFLQAYYLIIKPREVYGFVVNPHYLGTYCNIVNNAKMHIKKNYVLNIDLKDFFPSISARQIKKLFLSDYFSFPEQITTALTLLTTLDAQLPAGAPTSPVISNFVCLSLDQDLKSFCNLNSLVYSRYADDLTFSSDLPIHSDHILDLINLIKKAGFSINEKKLRLKTSDQRQVVTGLTVNEKVNVNRKLLKNMRAMLHDASSNGIAVATKRHFNLSTEADSNFCRKFINKLEGYINFVGQVRGKYDPLFTRQKASFDRIFEPKNIE